MLVKGLFDGSRNKLAIKKSAVRWMIKVFNWQEFYREIRGRALICELILYTLLQKGPYIS